MQFAKPMLLTLIAVSALTARANSLVCTRSDGGTLALRSADDTVNLGNPRGFPGGRSKILMYIDAAAQPSVFELYTMISHFPEDIVSYRHSDAQLKIDIHRFPPFDFGGTLQHNGTSIHLKCDIT